MYREIPKLLEKTKKITEKNVGIQFLEIHDGFARAEMQLKPEHYNFMGGIYGGILYHVADVTAGAAFMSAGGLGVTAAGDMQYLHGTHGSKTLFCEGKVLKYGSHISFAQAELMDENRTVFARGTFTFYQMPKTEALLDSLELEKITNKIDNE